MSELFTRSLNATVPAESVAPRMPASGNLYNVSIGWIIAAGIFVGARISTRVFIVKNPASDDVLIVLALVSASMSRTASDGQGSVSPLDPTRI